MSEKSVWLPFPPSVNNLFAQGVVKGKVRRFPSKTYKAWRKQALLHIMAARIRRFEEPVVVKLELTPRDNRPRDADNYSKAVLDALVAARVLPDDSNVYVKAVSAWFAPASASGHGVIVTLRIAQLPLFKAAAA
jgi:crossover junction endodeoxyribonuclease RusA